MKTKNIILILAFLFFVSGSIFANQQKTIFQNLPLMLQKSTFLSKTSSHQIHQMVFNQKNHFSFQHYSHSHGFKEMTTHHYVLLQFLLVPTIFFTPLGIYGIAYYCYHILRGDKDIVEKIKNHLQHKKKIKLLGSPHKANWHPQDEMDPLQIKTS